MAKKRSGSEKRRRTLRRAIRFSPAEDQAVAEMAKATGHSFSDLVRHALFSTPPPRRHSTDKELAARLLAQLGKIGSNVNQLAHYAHLGRYQESSVEMALRDLSELRIAILQFLGYERRHAEDPD